MSNWKEMLDSYGSVGFLATATSGLSHTHDKLLAVSYIMLAEGQRTEGRIMQLVEKAELDKAADYHKITVDRQNAEAIEPRRFQEELSRLLAGANWFTYNPQFQCKFLSHVLGYPVELHELPRYMKLADSGLQLPSTMTLRDVDKAASSLVHDNIIPFKSACTARGLDPNPPVGLLPCVHACRCLESLYKTLELVEVNVRQEEY